MSTMVHYEELTDRLQSRPEPRFVPEQEDRPVTVEPSLLAQAIEEHVALKKQNSALDQTMPLERYATEDPFENHPLFKTEEQARLEETMDGVPSPVAALAWPGSEPAALPELDDGLWARTRDFDWGR
jgi:hypothetical protein